MKTKTFLLKLLLWLGLIAGVLFLLMLGFGHLITQDGQFHRKQMDVEQISMDRDQSEQQYQRAFNEWNKKHDLNVEAKYQIWINEDDILEENSALKETYYSQSLAGKNKIYRPGTHSNPLKYLTEEIVYPKSLPRECGSACYMIGDTVLPFQGSVKLSVQFQETWAYIFDENEPTVVIYHPKKGIQQFDFPNLILGYKNRFYISDQGIDVHGPDFYQNYSFIRITESQVLGEWRKSQNFTNAKTCKNSFKNVNQYCEQLTSCSQSQFKVNEILENGVTEEGEKKLLNFEAQLKIEALTHLPGLNQKQLFEQCARRCEKQTIWYWNYKKEVCELSD